MKYIFNFFVNKYPLAVVGVIKYPVCLPLPLSVLLMPISGSCWRVSLQYWRSTWPVRISAIHLPPIHSWRTKSLKYIKWRVLLWNVLKTAWHSYSIPCDHVLECFCQFDPTVLLNLYTSVTFCVICVCVCFRWVFVYEKAYQVRDTAIESSVMTKVKGFGIYNDKVMDVADYVTPTQVWTYGWWMDK